MIIIHFSNSKKGGIIFARADLLDDRFQSLICGHKVYKVAKNSNVNHVLANVSALVDGLLKRLLESQADIICAHNVREISKSLRNFGWQRSHVCGLWSRKRSWKVDSVEVGEGAAGNWGLAFAFTVADGVAVGVVLLVVVGVERLAGSM